MFGQPWTTRLTPVVLLLATAGCKVGPKNFYAQDNLSPQVRSRAVTLGDDLPDAVAVPALIDRLNDPDSVVRLSAHETLKRRTGQDFGFVAWAEPADRARAVARWSSWWQSQAGVAVKVETQAKSRTRRRWFRR